MRFIAALILILMLAILIFDHPIPGYAADLQVMRSKGSCVVVYKSSITGHFVTEEFARFNPNISYRTCLRGTNAKAWRSRYTASPHRASGPR